MADVLPPNYVAVPSASRPGNFSYLCTTKNLRYASLDLAWAAYRRDSPIPPGFIPTASKSRPGETSYLCEASKEKYANLDLAWTEFRKQWALNSRPVLVAEALKIPVVPVVVVAPIPPVKSKRESIKTPINHRAPSAEEIPVPGRDGKFIDVEFPPTSVSMGPTVAEDPTSRLRITMEEKTSARWIRVTDLVRYNQGPSACAVLFDEIEPNDLIQGLVGDCWLLASMACLAEFPQSVEFLFEPKTVSDSGRYVIKLYDLTQMKWVEVVIDDYIPCVLRDDYSLVPFRINDKGQKVYSGNVPPSKKWKPLFANPSGNEMWCLLLEKAFAKFVGDYSRIAGGHEPFAFISFTGFPQVYQFKRPAVDKEMTAATPGIWERGWSQWIARTRPTCAYRPVPDGTRLDEDGMFDRLAEYDLRNFMMAASISCHEPVRGSKGHYRQDGLVVSHAYSLISAVRIDLEPGKQIRLVQLRNPHGKKVGDTLSEWQGKWSDGSKEWTEFPIAAEHVLYSPANDGMFWMSWDDFSLTFDNVLVLAKSMSQPRSVFAASRRAFHAKNMAHVGKVSLGIAFKNLEDDSLISALKRMSVQPYDPFLNPPEWIKLDQKLHLQWATEKGLIKYK